MDTTLRFSYASAPSDSSRGLAGIVITILLHVVLAYALFNGLGRKMIQVLQQPLDVAIVEEIKAPEQKPPPPVKVARPPPSYVPPPDTRVQIQSSAPTITATTTTPEPQPVEPVRVAPPAPPAPVVVPAPVNVSIACPNHASVRANVQYPAQAQRMGLSGDVLVEFIVGSGGEIKDISIARSSNPVFNGAATSAVAQLRCVGQGQDARVRVPFVFRLES
jgi:periplasmic protein TonB